MKLQLVVCLTLLSSVSASHLCTGLHAAINITHQGSNTALLRYSADLTYDVLKSGFETMNVFNTQLWSVNSSFSASDLTFYSEVTNLRYKCPSDLGNCTLTFVDGGGLLELDVGVEGVYSTLLILDDVTYYKGTVFWNDGMVLTPDNACIIGEEWVSNLVGSVMTLEYCCNRWETLPNSVPVNNTCLEFSSNTDFYNASTTLASIRFKYEHFVGQKMVITGTNFTTNFETDLFYMLSTNYGGFPQCRGTPTNFTSTCGAQLYDQLSVADSEFVFFLDLYDNAQQRIHWHSVPGAFEFRNYTLMRNGSDPFTPQKNCAQYNIGPIGTQYRFRDDGISSKSDFCCTKWQNPPVTGKCTNLALNFTVYNASSSDQGIAIGTATYALAATPGSYHLTPKSFSSAFNPATFNLFIYKSSFEIENCLRNSSQINQMCTLAEVEGQSYQWSFSTSFAPDSFSSFSTSAKNGVIATNPPVTKSDTCFDVTYRYNAPFPQMSVLAHVCCNRWGV